MSRFLPVGKGVKGAAGFLLAAIPALGAVLTGLAITGGLVGHMARDHPLASYGAFGLAVLAIFAGAVATPVPAGDYDDLGARAWVGDEPKECYAHGNTTGCVRVHVPRPQERPQLAVTWETFVRAPRLLIRLTAKNLPQRPAKSMTLRAVGITTDHIRRELAQWSPAPNAEVELDRRLAVVGGHAFADVCVVASTSRSEPACPAPAEDGTVWSQLAVPAV